MTKKDASIPGASSVSQSPLYRVMQWYGSPMEYAAAQHFGALSQSPLYRVMQWYQDVWRTGHGDYYASRNPLFIGSCSDMELVRYGVIKAGTGVVAIPSLSGHAVIFPVDD